MIFKYPGRILAIGIAMMIFGVVMPFLMVLHLVESTFFWNFLSFIGSTLGFYLGLIGFISLNAKRKRAKDKSDGDGFDSFGR
jgi:hypothetical protein